jgi:hypothetical protein
VKTHALRGALEAIDRILNRGGDADDVLRAVLDVLAPLYPAVRIDFVEAGGIVPGPAHGEASAAARRLPVLYRGTHVAELVVDGAGPEDQAFLERVAVLISAHCLVGWDTGGVAWQP